MNEKQAENNVTNSQKLRRVSIIIPCYNQENYVAEAIVSALAQTYENIEIVCYNDGSSDNSSAVISEYAQKYDNILFIDCKENKGVVFARNTAIANCSGDYILPLDADDKIDPTYVEKAAKILDKQVNTGIVYCRGRYIGAKKGEWKLPAFDRNEILYSNCIPNCALFRKSDFENVGGYHDYMNGGYEDWDLWLSFLSRGLDVHRLDEILFSYRKQNVKTRNDIKKDVADKLFKAFNFVFR